MLELHLAVGVRRDGAGVGVRAVKHAAEAIVMLAIIGCCLVSCGNPDILDGLIKRANDCEVSK